MSPRALLTSLVVACLLVTSLAFAQEMPAYSWDMPVEDVAVFDGLTYASGGVAVTVAEGYCGPIVVELPDEAGQNQPAVTGLEALGAGVVKIEQGGEVIFEDDIYGAMFRFHPDDYEAFVTVEGQQARPEAGLRKLLLHACYGSFKRFWHRGMQAFVPPQATVAAYVYSASHGGVMIYQKDGQLVGYCMDTKSELFRH